MSDACDFAVSRASLIFTGVTHISEISGCRMLLGGVGYSLQSCAGLHVAASGLGMVVSGMRWGCPLKSSCVAPRVTCMPEKQHGLETVT